MHNDTPPSPQRAPAEQTAMNLPPDRPGGRLRRWVTAVRARLARAEKRIIERFRVPPNGA
ncbi:hypothetical protein LMG3458_05708 [Achromobacter deleyi]|uniref:Uncharacterized protein n=1 Tax=Achromobacter deleyi TaxID=1353891 RepID=A0A6S7AYA7_9BURK|nr:hypothetical protein LMG3458_05708 [Achromobacter deleyi]CAB3903072.1 hypothetical protein LMG3481_04375 [Achromobacter deleyi]CAB3910858.1 hypothetical protein LMG3482_04812 [Achromobacter deleyi]